ncbi:hypothetical protein Tco_0237052 [Tanacetum coccineum]
MQHHLATRPSASTKHKGKEIAKPITPQSSRFSLDEDSELTSSRDKENEKEFGTPCKYFKNSTTTQQQLQTSSNSQTRLKIPTPCITITYQVKAFWDPKTLTVAGLGKIVQSLEDTDEEIDEQELEAHYSYMAKIQEVSPEESSSTGQPLEQVQNHDESNVYDNVRRHSEQPESINDTYVLEKDDSNVTPDSSIYGTNDNQENKTILKQLKKANASLTQELEKCKTNLDETNSALGEAISCRDSFICLRTNRMTFESTKPLMPDD